MLVIIMVNITREGVWKGVNMATSCVKTGR